MLSLLRKQVSLCESVTKISDFSIRTVKAMIQDTITCDMKPLNSSSLHRKQNTKLNSDYQKLVIKYLCLKIFLWWSTKWGPSIIQTFVKLLKRVQKHSFVAFPVQLHCPWWSPFTWFFFLLLLRYVDSIFWLWTYTPCRSSVQKHYVAFLPVK